LSLGEYTALAFADSIDFESGLKVVRQRGQAMQAAALANHDTFADVRGRFSGHEICDSGSWLHSVDIFAISSSYHPTAAGQELGYLPVFTGAA